MAILTELSFILRPMEETGAMVNQAPDSFSLEAKSRVRALVSDDSSKELKEASMTGVSQHLCLWAAEGGGGESVLILCQSWRAL